VAPASDRKEALGFIEQFFSPRLLGSSTDRWYTLLVRLQFRVTTESAGVGRKHLFTLVATQHYLVRIITGMRIIGHQHMQDETIPTNFALPIDGDLQPIQCIVQRSHFFRI